MPPRTRISVEDIGCRKIPIQTLFSRRKLRLGEYTDGFLLDDRGPRFSAFLGCDGCGWIQVGRGRWLIERRYLTRGGFRFDLRASNGQRHTNLFIVGDRVGTVSELGLTWNSKRMTKAKRAVNRRGKLLRVIEGR